MRKFTILPALAAALLLAACADDNPLRPEARPEAAGPQLATAPVGPQWSLYGSQSPDQTNDATPGWEVATRFRTSKAGKVIGFRFWRASGETGTNTARLWTDGGQQLRSKSFTTSGTGWQTVYLTTAERVSLQTNTNYRVSVNTNTAQVKRGGAYVSDGSLSSGPLYSDGGYYGQPTGSMPTSQSASYFFVDVIFEEDVPLPNLYIGNIFLGRDYWQNQIITVHVCNNGAASAGASTTRVKHWWTPSGPWQLQWDTSTPTPAIAAGTCTALNYFTNAPQGNNLWEAFADATDVVYESNENDNYRSITGLF